MNDASSLRAVLYRLYGARPYIVHFDTPASAARQVATAVQARHSLDLVWERSGKYGIAPGVDEALREHLAAAGRGDDQDGLLSLPVSDPEHFTAWLTTSTDCLDQPNADLTILVDEPHGADGWASTSESVWYGILGVRADVFDAPDVADAMLAGVGWCRTGPWVGCDTGAHAAVERVG